MSRFEGFLEKLTMEQAERQKFAVEQAKRQMLQERREELQRALTETVEIKRREELQGLLTGLEEFERRQGLQRRHTEAGEKDQGDQS